MNERFLKIYDKEINEIKQNKKRFGVIIVTLMTSLLMFTFTNNDDEIVSTSEVETPKATAKAEDENSAKSKGTAKLTKIAGLEKATEDVKLVNPFKVDVQEPKVAEFKTENKPVINTPAFNPPKPTMPIKTDESSEKIVFTLKGIAISGDKKMAIIQRSTADKNNSKDTKSSTDTSTQESFILNLGDEVAGRRIVEIDKFSVTFDDGYKLYIQEAVQ